MTKDEIIKAVETETEIKGVTLATTMESLNLDSLSFMALMLKCNVPREKEVGINTVGDIVKAVSA
jgi:acyl carrier protein